jgi:hypothetical protein
MSTGRIVRHEEATRPGEVIAPVPPRDILEPPPTPQYDVAADGRFLINVNTDEANTSPITIIQNWQPKQ